MKNFKAKEMLNLAEFNKAIVHNGVCDCCGEIKTCLSLAYGKEYEHYTLVCLDCLQYEGEENE